MMGNQVSRYERQTWTVAFLLAVLLIVLWLMGMGPCNSCCNKSNSASKGTSTEGVTNTPDNTPFSFKASGTEFESSGNSSQVGWFNRGEALKAQLANGGNNLSLDGNASAVVLRGEVDSVLLKEQKELELKTLLGESVSIDNQLTVKVVAPQTPSTAKLFFAVGQTNLPPDANATLEPIATWLKATESAKAVISGFHDASGNADRNNKVAKKRAQATQAALVSMGIAAERIELRKPQTTLGGDNSDEARRVEVSVE